MQCLVCVGNPNISPYDCVPCDTKLWDFTANIKALCEQAAVSFLCVCRKLSEKMKRRQKSDLTIFPLLLFFEFFLQLLPRTLFRTVILNRGSHLSFLKFSLTFQKSINFYSEWFCTTGYQKLESFYRKSNQIFYYTRCNTPKRVTSLRGPSPRHFPRATQLL